MEYSIPINKQNILEVVKRITGYTGKGVGENIDKITVTDDESGVIEGLTEKSIVDFLSKIGRFSPVYSSEVIKVELPANFDSKVQPLLEKAVEDMIVNDASSSWFFIVRMNEDAEKYGSMALNSFQNVLRLLCSRIKPS